MATATNCFSPGRLSRRSAVGLMAGLFFAFSVSVMKALARLPSAEGIAAMQSINVAIINPVFFAAFFGTAAACVRREKN